MQWATFRIRRRQTSRSRPPLTGGELPGGGFVIGADVTPIPSDFFGWYLESAYRGFQGGRWDHALPALRALESASDYASLGEGLGLPGLDDLKAWTVGFNFTLAPGVVLKADYLNLLDSDEGDRTDLSVGYAF